MKPKTILIVAGEASGDLHGANLIREIRSIKPEIQVCGVGGHKLREAGVRIIIEADELSVVGITEALAKAPKILRSLKILKQEFRVNRPDLVILIDFPDFNFIVGSMAHAHQIPVLYYISPQLWAWRAGRIHKLKKFVSHIAVILPFEEKLYRRHKIPVTFVGHPLLDNRMPLIKQEPEHGKHSIHSIGLLPGSRPAEVAKLLPIMLDAAALIAKSSPNIKFIVSAAASVNPALISSIVANWRQPYVALEIIHGDVHQVLDQSHLVIAASGTVALETALHNVPMVIIYQVSPISYALGKLLIKVKYICLVNLISGREIVPELIQEQANPQQIAHQINRFLLDENYYQHTRKELARLSLRLGGRGASAATARIAADMLKSYKQAEIRDNLFDKCLKTKGTERS